MGEKKNAVSHMPNSHQIAGTESGHRARLLERYVRSGMSSLCDYEILELMLTFALPRRDTKPLAKKLMARYGTISAVISAPPDELREVGGLGKRSAALLTLIKDTLSYCLNEASVNKPVLAYRDDMDEYLRLTFGHDREECVAAVFLDAGNRLICTEVISRGTVKRCVANPRALMERAMKCGAASFILAHNHPAGAALPSESDWQTTELLHKTGKLMDIRMIDHVIISKDAVTSLRQYRRWPSWP